MNTNPEYQLSTASIDEKADMPCADKTSFQACREHWVEEKNQRRHEWISVSAYFKAEKRGFEPNHEWDDWFEAEIEYAKIQVDEFLAILEEDGEATLFGLQKLAHSIGVEHPENIHSKTDLIQAIQCACQLLPCFRTDNEEICKQFTDCQWRSECKKLIADWKSHEKHR